METAFRGSDRFGKGSCFEFGVAVVDDNEGR